MTSSRRKQNSCRKTIRQPGLHAEGILQLYKGGFLSATSVGFNPLKYAFTDDPKRRYGIDFLEQELLEFSCVTVPANAEALIEGRAAGIDVTPMLDWCEQQMKRCGDNERIVKLAEDVLGGSGDDLVALSWAERIVAASAKMIVPAGSIIVPKGSVVVTAERAAAITRMEAAATADRLRKKRARDLELAKLRA
jgi:hypothetical protein